MNNSRFWILTTMILGVALVRLIAIPAPNFEPIGAIALFGAATFRFRVWGFIMPLLALFLSDVILEIALGTGFYGGMPFVYGAFLCSGLLGLFLRKNKSLLRISAVAITSAVVFFLITNFSVWLMGAMYPKTLSGLLLCYEAGLLFFKQSFFGNFFFNTVYGTLFFSYILFGVWALLKIRLPKLVLAN